MSRSFILPALLLVTTLLPGCQNQAPEPAVDMDALRKAVARKTEELYLIHLKLDSAATDITAAELKSRNADCSDAEYLAAEAYRNVQRADEDLLELGKELQELFNLDVARANRN